MPGHPAQRSLGPPADDDRYRRLRGGPDAHPVQLEEAPRPGDLLAVQERPQHGQRLIQPASPGARVDPAGEQFGRVVATQSDAEEQPPAGQSGERGDLPGDRDGVAQGQQVHRGLHDEPPGRHGESRSGQQPVKAVTALERDMIPDAQAVDPRRLDPGHELPQAGRTAP